MIPIFKNTEQALAYGKLVGGDTEKINEMVKERGDLLASAHRFEEVEEYQKAMNLICQAQFVREALEEATSDKYKLKDR